MRPPSTIDHPSGHRRASATPSAKAANHASVRFASTQASPVSTAQPIDSAVKATRIAKIARATAPGTSPARAPKSTAAAPATPARISTAISTVVSGPSWSPPWPSSASAASSVPKATVASVRPLRPGTATERAAAGRSAVPARVDTVQADEQGREQGEERERRQQDDDGRRQRRGGGGDVADGARRQQRLLGGRLRRRGRRLIGGARLRGPPRLAGGAARTGRRGSGRLALLRRGAGAAAAARAAAAAARRRGLGPGRRVAVAPAQRGEPGALDHVAARGVLVAVGRQLVER